MSNTHHPPITHHPITITYPVLPSPPAATTTSPGSLSIPHVLLSPSGNTYSLRSGDRRPLDANVKSACRSWLTKHTRSFIRSTK